jgi:hypothetical protein
MQKWRVTYGSVTWNSGNKMSYVQPQKLRGQVLKDRRMCGGSGSVLCHTTPVVIPVAWLQKGVVVQPHCSMRWDSIQKLLYMCADYMKLTTTTGYDVTCYSVENAAIAGIGSAPILHRRAPGSWHSPECTWLSSEAMIQNSCSVGGLWYCSRHLPVCTIGTQSARTCRSGCPAVHSQRAVRCHALCTASPRRTLKGRMIETPQARAGRG